MPENNVVTEGRGSGEDLLSIQNLMGSKDAVAGVIDARGLQAPPKLNSLRKKLNNLESPPSVEYLAGVLVSVTAEDKPNYEILSLATKANPDLAAQLIPQGVVIKGVMLNKDDPNYEHALALVSTITSTDTDNGLALLDTICNGYAGVVADLIETNPDNATDPNRMAQMVKNHPLLAGNGSNIDLPVGSFASAYFKNGGGEMKYTQARAGLMFAVALNTGRGLSEDTQKILRLTTEKAIDGLESRGETDRDPVFTEYAKKISQVLNNGNQPDPEMSTPLGTIPTEQPSIDTDSPEGKDRETGVEGSESDVDKNIISPEQFKHIKEDFSAMFRGELWRILIKPAGEPGNHTLNPAQTKRIQGAIEWHTKHGVPDSEELLKSILTRFATKRYDIGKMIIGSPGKPKILTEHKRNQMILEEYALKDAGVLLEFNNQVELGIAIDQGRGTRDQVVTLLADYMLKDYMRQVVYTPDYRSNPYLAYNPSPRQV